MLAGLFVVIPTIAAVVITVRVRNVIFHAMLIILLRILKELRLLKGMQL